MKPTRNVFSLRSLVSRSRPYAATIAISLCASHMAYAANQTWSATPTDATWALAANWAGAAVPGVTYVTGNTVGLDIATFSSAIATFGGALNPVSVDLNRLLLGVTFDTANAGAYVLGGAALKVSHNGLIQATAAVVNAQTINAAIEIRLPSSTNGTQTFRNNAAATNATLTFNGAVTSQAASSRPLTLNLDGLNTGSNAITNVLSHGLGQQVNVVKGGVGTWILGGANDFGANASATNAGSTTINGGTLIVLNNASLSTNTANNTGVFINNTGSLEISGTGLVMNDGLSLNLASGGTIRSNGSNTTNGRVNLATAAATSATLSTVSVGDVFTIGNAVNDVTGGASDTVINITGPGTVSLAQAGNYAGGWSVNGGTLLLGTPTSLGNTAASVGFGAAGTGKLVLNGNNVTIGSLSSAGGTPTVENNSATAATLTVSKISGSTTFEGALQNGVTGGALSLIKAGASTLVLNGASTYTGTTSVNGGILGGTGSIASAVTVASGAAIAPGAGGVGTLTAGPLTLDSGSLLNYDITNSTTLDKITVNGALTLNGGQLNINGGVAAFTANGVYNLIGGYTGAIGGTGVGALTVNSLNQDVTKSYTFGQSGGFVTLAVADSGAAISYWNTNGSGNWSTGPWTTPTPNAIGAFASFGGGGTTITAPRTVTVDGAFTVGTLGFNNATQAFTLASGGGANITLQATSGAASVAATAGSHQIQAPLTLTSSGATFQVTTLGDTLAVSGVVSGNGPLTKIGNGTLTLTGLNTYTGNTQIDGGTVSVNSVSSLGDATFLTTIGNATLQATADITTPRNFNLTHGASTISVDATKTYSITGIVGAGAGTLNKTGAGTLVLTGANTYTGGTVVGAGTLNVIDGALGTAPVAPATNLTLNGGATLQAGAAIVTIVANRSVVLNGGTANIDSNGNNITLAGSLSGSGLLRKIGAGNLTLSGANNSGTASGGTTIDAGTVFVASQVNLPGGILTLNGTGGITASAAANFAPVVNGTNFITGTATAILGLGNLSGAGTLTFGGPFVNDYTGNFTAFTGTLIASGGGSRWNGSTGGTNLTLDLVNTGTSVRNTAAGITIGALVGSATSTLSGSGGGATQAVTYTIGGKTVGGLGLTPVDSTFNGIIQNGAANTNITKVGGSTLTLTGTSPYAGATTINGGTLYIAAGGALSATAFLNTKTGTTIVDGTVTPIALTIGASAGDLGIFTAKGVGSVTASADFNVGDTGSPTTAAVGTLNIQDTASVTIGAVGGFYVGSAYFAGTDLATGTVNQSGGTLLHNNAATGTFVIGGRNGALGTGTYNLSAGTATSSSVVYVGGAGTGMLNLSATGAFNANAGLLLGNGAAAVGSVNLNGGTLSATTVNKGAGSGTFNFNGGALVAKGASATFMTGLTAANVQAGGALINDGGFAITIGQALLNGGAGGLTKSGSGTVTLTGANTYVGNTTVAAGTLSVNSAYFADASTVSVASGAVIALNHGATDIVGSLILGGVVQPNGTYDSATPGGFITGLGKIQVGNVVVSDYNTWLALYAFPVGADTSPTGDPDGDGLTNQMEYAFGLAPNSGSSVNPLTTQLDKTTGIFSYQRRDNATTGLSYKVWTSTNLGAWTQDVGAVQSEGSVVAGNEVVTVTLSGTKPLTAPTLFVRVTAE